MLPDETFDWKGKEFESILNEISTLVWKKFWLKIKFKTISMATTETDKRKKKLRKCKIVQRPEKQ